jgi:hypothetical protein
VPEFYLFKLEFPDHRWDVAAKQLMTPPAEGDFFVLDTGSRWRVVGKSHVRPRPSAKPWRAMFVCAPA